MTTFYYRFGALGRSMAGAGREKADSRAVAGPVAPWKGAAWRW